MSIDYLAMPGIENDTEQRGGELITIHTDGSWDLLQLPLESLTQSDHRIAKSIEDSIDSRL